MSNPVPAVSHGEALVETFLPALRPAERGGLALRVVALLIAESCRERTILTTLAPLGYAASAPANWRRERAGAGWGRAGPTRSAPRAWRPPCWWSRDRTRPSPGCC
ncbi:MAG: hypothetical protein ACRDJC_27055 [Thermomicrobiales bacterium]